MKQETKTNYVAPEVALVQIELEQCIAQSGTLNAFDNNVIVNEELFPGII